MNSYAELLAYVQEHLAVHAAERLYEWQDRGARYINTSTGWFYEGTVQGQLLALIEAAIGDDIERWLVLQEQRYPGLPDNRADLWVVAPGGHDSLVIEVKADFKLDSAEDDYSKLLIANPRNFTDGFVFFCVELDDLERWQKKIETNPGNRVYARGIARQV